MSIRESLTHAHENLTKARLGVQRLWCLAHAGHLDELDADVLELTEWLLQASVGLGEALDFAPPVHSTNPAIAPEAHQNCRRNGARGSAESALPATSKNPVFSGVRCPDTSQKPRENSDGAGAAGDTVGGTP